MSDKILRRWNDTPEIRKVDAETRTVEFVASDNSVDSYGTVLPVDKWDLTRYASNGHALRIQRDRRLHARRVWRFLDQERRPG